jgi:hypothetical protein
MRFVHAALLLAVMCSPAFAQREPEIVIPGKAGVPVIIDGVDASWSVVEGEFGLDRPGAMAPVIIFRPVLATVPYAVPQNYFPRTGQTPGYGRLEIIPPPDAPKPPPAPTFYRSWSSQSAPGPVTDYPPYPMPPVVVQPGFGQDHDHHGRRGGLGAGPAAGPTGPGSGRPPVNGP